MKAKGFGALSWGLFLSVLVQLVAWPSLHADVGTAHSGTAHSAGTGPFAVAILATRAKAEDLSLVIRWGDQLESAWTRIELLDKKGIAIDGRWVWSVPGESSSHIFANFLQRVPDDGFQFAAVVRDAKGTDLSRAHAFRVFFDCSGAGVGCEWQTVDLVGKLVCRGSNQPIHRRGIVGGSPQMRRHGLLTDDPQKVVRRQERHPYGQHNEKDGRGACEPGRDSHACSAKRSTLPGVLSPLFRFFGSRRR